MSISRACPICGTPSSSAKIFQKENIDESRISGFSYASRKEPEYMCHELVQCPVCDLVYVSRPPAQEELANAYHVADYDSSEEATDAAQAYMLAMDSVLSQLKRRDSVLEIGSGTGVLLDMLRARGFSELVGVEPSSAAINAAPEHRRSWLREGIFREADFAPESFDLICCFMTMEHVQDPMATAQSAARLLRPGGAFVTVTHDYRSFVNRAMGKRSPIIDIEHMQLFSQASIRELMQRCGFGDISVKPFVNRYTLSYWMRLAPLPFGLKSSLKKATHAVGLSKKKIGLNVGNTLAAGYRINA
ncbi:class I SAM-dependent methyltransferase [Achromobacter denitrificans]|uniref:class I SAM-dependent methyltransferase n=1 Tax=Achromobacter denitrificans TaxID=32002 RepID=UPI0029BD9405|nr:class I SAM-dependent methyltransferase [Achromobacter sp.]